MFKGWFKPKTMYVQVLRNQFKLYCSHSKQLVMANGEFSHPRMLLGSFSAAETLLKNCLAEQNKLSKPSDYRVVIHPKELMDGGLSEIEQRALQELFLTVGFRQAQIWQGQDLCDSQLEEFQWQK